MLLTIATTHRPATDPGYLLMKHPDNVHAAALPFGSATVLYPQADETRCEAALVVEVDPVALVRGRGGGQGREDHVNDRPHAASLLLAAAIHHLRVSVPAPRCTRLRRQLGFPGHT